MPMLVQKLQICILVPKKEPKWLLPDTFPYLKIYLNVFAFGLHPWPHWGSSWRCPGLLAGLGCNFLEERGREDKKKEGKKGKGGYKGRRGGLAPKRVYWVCPLKCGCPRHCCLHVPEYRRCICVYLLQAEHQANVAESELLRLRRLSTRYRGLICEC